MIVKKKSSIADAAFAGALMLLLSGCVSTMSKQDQIIWAQSFNADTGERFIPPELWSGDPWDGNTSLARLPKLDHMATRSNLPSRILTQGPEGVSQKEHPNCSKQVYVRKNIHPSRGTYKTQYFQVNLDDNGKVGGIGRCWEIRDGTIRHMSEFSKFPIGYWKAGDNYKGIRITSIGTPESPCLTFQWQGQGYYSYCPNQGNVSQN
ncbi:hypothetical protein [Magnetovibrio blakemorei]|uniref:Lipoprotein n=1 Tax=Magnetovibrio blakemorei TaxID=28181 RepID=A0A1E5Q9X9_9PROT|nr:hypothetical protein [Magnetovibrio blakemorei]OEJ68526.1 hypothetical protein BEN30_06265 [Magnetovibrio blakemorei]